MNMIRKEIELDEAQWQRLEALAAETGKSVNELVRESLAALSGKAVGASGERPASVFTADELDEDGKVKDWKAGLKKLGSAWAGRDDMQALTSELRREQSERIDDRVHEPSDE